MCGELGYNIREWMKIGAVLWRGLQWDAGKNGESEWQCIWLIPTGYTKLLLDMFHDSS